MFPISLCSDFGRSGAVCLGWMMLMTGIFIGVNAACINVITEWLSDFKLGYCTDHWYLNQQFCCWQESLETCTNWRSWSSITLINYIFYILFAVSSLSWDAFCSIARFCSALGSLLARP